MRQPVINTVTNMISALILTLVAVPATGTTVLQDGAIVQFHKAASDQVNLDIRLANSEPVTKVTASIAGVPVTLSKQGDYLDQQRTSAVLLLVDTSDPSRQQAVSQATNHIKQILQQSPDHLRYGLARFDTDLEILAPLGSSHQQIASRSRSLKATGKTTELYRNTLNAIRALSRYPSDRKFLFLFSDGLAEDRAYFHRDVVQAALRNDINIYTIGYSGTVSRTVALQTLRRLSEDTGGLYLATNPGTFRLDNLALQDMLDTMDDGVQLAANFKAMSEVGIGGRQQLDLSINSAGNNLIISLPVKLTAALAPSQSQQIIYTSPSQQVRIERITQTKESTSKSGLLLVALSLLLMGLVIFLALRLRNNSANAGSNAASLAQSSADEEPYAWLERIDAEDKQRFPIHSNLTKIGRFRGNDVTLHDPAISRYHAEIIFADNGSFMVVDLDSKNGLIVNDNEVHEQILNDQDIIEIGDIRLRFIIPEGQALDMQDTQMFRTQFPPPNSANH